MSLGAAPDHAFGPQRMLPQLMDGGMIVALHLIGQRQVAWIKYPHLGAEQDQQPSRFLGREPAERAFAQRPVE